MVPNSRFITVEPTVVVLNILYGFIHYVAAFAIVELYFPACLFKVVNQLTHRAKAICVCGLIIGEARAFLQLVVGSYEFVYAVSAIVLNALVYFKRKLTELASVLLR